MKTERPILFSTPMVQAILQDKKCMTRRIIKYKKEIINPEIGKSIFTGNEEFSVRGVHKNGQYGESIFKIPYKIGDVLWVRETFAPINCGNSFIYKANFTNSELKDKNGSTWWKPSLFMPRKACRLFLKITDIKTERLQDISSNDILKEGIRIPISKNGNPLFILGEKNSPITFMRQYDPEIPWTDSEILHANWKSLWININKEASWNSNPLVWCISFKRIDK